jgi:hypothetical protein
MRIIRVVIKSKKQGDSKCKGCYEATKKNRKDLFHSSSKKPGIFKAPFEDNVKPKL